MKQTTITITVRRDRMNREQNKLWDRYVTPENLKRTGMGAQTTVMEALNRVDTVVTVNDIETCPHCRGNGYTIDGNGTRMTKDRCDPCEGAGRIAI